MDKFNWNKLLYVKREREHLSVEKTDNDKRSDFKKDLDTIRNCTGIRRLQDKAQVFPLERGDYARTRLTHSIEVESIAESLGIHAVKVIMSKSETPLEESLKSKINEIPTILRAAAFLHDMGNPPFGHLGEKIIGDWFEENLGHLLYNNKHKKVVYGENTTNTISICGQLSDAQKYDLTHFDGNAQLLRLASKLNYVVDEHGMNLTYPVLATIIKYPYGSDNPNIYDESATHKNKIGYFQSEKELYEDINKTLELDHKRHPLAFLLEAADDIAYLTADIEDAHKKGIITLEYIEECFKNEPDELSNKICKEIIRYREDGNKENVYDIDSYVVRRLRIFIKGQMISSVMKCFEEKYSIIMEGNFTDELLVASSAQNVANIIRNKIENDHIYFCKEIRSSKIKAFKILNYLLDKFVLAVFNSDVQKKEDTRDNLIYNLMSDNYRFICDKNIKMLNIKNNSWYEDKDYIYNKLLLVTDFISGMTDTYANDIYNLLVAL